MNYDNISESETETNKINIWIKYLSIDITREIFSFIIPDSNNISFRNEYPKSNHHSYSSKYEVAYLHHYTFNPSTNDDIIHDSVTKIMNPYTDTYLCRIPKKNGKHCYYLTKELVDTIEIEHNDRMVEIYYYDYLSKYVGKNIDIALIELYCSKQKDVNIIL